MQVVQAAQSSLGGVRGRDNASVEPEKFDRGATHVLYTYEGMNNSME